MMSTVTNSKTKGKYVFLLFAMYKYRLIEIMWLTYSGMYVNVSFFSFERARAGEMHFNLQNHVYQFVSYVETLIFILLCIDSTF